MSGIDTLVIFGAAGDLTSRLLLPGLGSLLASDDEDDRGLADGLSIIGCGRRELSDAEWQGMVGDALRKGGADERQAKRISAKAGWMQADATSRADMEKVLGAARGIPALYFALPPDVVSSAADALRDIDLPEGTLLAMEKPFGSDARSARTLNRKLVRLVPEEQIHRIDHFLGQPTVLNILGLRFGNRIFEPVWNAENIERVEIVYDEELGLEGRAGYYDGAGALIDMLQSHLLQVLAVFAMEPPATLEESGFRDSIAQVLRATAIWDGEPALSGTDAPSRRARYTAGTVGDRKFPAYAAEEGVDPERETETLAEIAVGVNTARWAGVPFVLRSGKAIGSPRRGIEVHFRPLRFLPHGLEGRAAPNRLVIGIRPETLQLQLTMMDETEPFALGTGALEGELTKRQLTEYGEVLRGVLGGDPTLSVRGDVAEQCWRIVAPVLNSWRKGDIPLDEYRAGSAGPSNWR